jgi:excisionase family DNA binding protein
MSPRDDTYDRATEKPLTAADVMTASDVAVLLHAPVSTVEDWARRGILPSVKIGRRRLYIRQSIEAVLTSGTPTR